MAPKSKLSIVVIRWGWEILHHLADGFQKLGHDVRFYELDEKSDLNGLMKDLKEKRPDFCLTNNLYIFDNKYSSDPSGTRGQEFENFIKTHSIPFISWYWENPASTGTLVRQNLWQSGPYPTHLHFLAVDDRHLDFFKQRKLNAAFMPLGLDERMKDFKPAPELIERFQTDLSYSGMPDLMTPTRPPKTESQLRSLYETFTLQQLLLGISELVDFEPEFREKNLNALREKFLAPMRHFYSRLYFGSGAYDQAFTGLMTALNTTIPAELRPVLAMLKGRIDFCYSYYLTTVGLNELKEFSPRIFGGDNWANWLMGSLAGIKTPRLTEDELKALFFASKISFCLTKTQFSNFFHERIFTVLACRGFPLTDNRRCIEEFFPKSTIATYQGFEDAKDRVKYFLSHESERLSMASKAREWAFQHHTLQRRAQQIVEVCQKDFQIF